MLGFDGALNVPRSGGFGQGSGPVLLTYVSCEGTEGNLADCAHAGIGRYSCNHARDAGAVCFSGEPFQVRLTNGKTVSEGRVEVSYKASWGTICDDNWDLRDARVVCNVLGFDGALAAPGSATFGAGSGKILFDDVDCKGTEDTLLDCWHRGLGVNNCNHYNDAAAVCFTGAPFLVRLVNGSNDLEGRVEVMYDGSWGTICDDDWDLRDARVVCKMLKFDGALAAPGSATFGQGSGDVLLDDVSCESTHSNLADCYHRGIGVSDCQHECDSGAICFTGEPFTVRLRNGSTASEGRVEIMYNGSWGTVCGIRWDLDDARVVCRMMGFDGALAASVSGEFGRSEGDIFLSDVQCDGTENSLADCNHAGIGVNNCIQVIDSEATCICFSGVRLVGGTNNAEGRVEILHDGSWGTVCDDSWDLKDAEVVCRMLGFVGALKAPLDAHFGKGSGTIFLDEVRCNGTEVDLEHCDHEGIGVHNCAHNEDASVICIQPDLTIKLASIVYGVCIILSSFFVVVTLTYLIRVVRKKTARRNLENEIYMDFQDRGLNTGEVAPSMYQDLNAPPSLPERTLTTSGQSTMGSSLQRFHNHDERILAHDDKERDSSHEYTGMGTTNKTASTSEDEHSYAYNIHLENSEEDNGSQDHTTAMSPAMSTTITQEEAREPISHGQFIGQNKLHGYMVMNTVSKKIDVGKDEDIDGYLLPSKTSATPKSQIRAEQEEATIPADNDKISEPPRSDCSQHAQDENTRIKKEAQNTKRLGAHEYLDMTSFGQGMSKEKEIDTDGSTNRSGFSSEMNDENSK
nr:LOW QUALITY PROTEIN: deleted in malignant brain tumors 1 protein-like [Lytechinus pictus]